MEFKELIEARRSVRKYAASEISEAEVETIVGEAGLTGGSVFSHEQAPLRFSFAWSRGSDSNRRVLADPDYKSGAVNHCATPAAK